MVGGCSPRLLVRQTEGAADYPFGEGVIHPTGQQIEIRGVGVGEPYIVASYVPCAISLLETRVALAGRHSVTL